MMFHVGYHQWCQNPVDFCDKSGSEGNDLGEGPQPDVQHVLRQQVEALLRVNRLLCLSQIPAQPLQIRS